MSGAYFDDRRDLVVARETASRSHDWVVTVADSLIAIVGLFVIAGGGIVLIDALILRRIRNQPKTDLEQAQDPDEVSPDS